MLTLIVMLQIPAEITAALEPIKDNEEAVKNYGIHLGTEMCKKILAHGIKTLHLYTLNMEKSALAILMVVSPYPNYLYRLECAWCCLHDWGTFMLCHSSLRIVVLGRILVWLKRPRYWGPCPGDAQLMFSAWRKMFVQSSGMQHMELLLSALFSWKCVQMYWNVV